MTPSKRRNKEAKVEAAESGNVGVTGLTRSSGGLVINGAVVVVVVELVLKIGSSPVK